MEWRRIGTVDQLQEIEDFLYDLLTKRDVNTAEGVWLDKIGKIVGRSRVSGQSDDEYRLFLKMQITLNRSTGAPETLIQALTILTDSSFVELKEFFPGAVQLDFTGTVTGSPQSLLSLMDDAALGGVRVTLNQIDPNNRGFRYSSTVAPVTGSDRGYGTTLASDVGGYYAGLIGE